MRVIAKEWAFQQADACGFFFIPSLVSPRLDHMMASGVVGPTLDFDLGAPPPYLCRPASSTVSETRPDQLLLQPVDDSLDPGRTENGVGVFCSLNKSSSISALHRRGDVLVGKVQTAVSWLRRTWDRGLVKNARHGAWLDPLDAWRHVVRLQRFFLLRSGVQPPNASVD